MSEDIKSIIEDCKRLVEQLKKNANYTYEMYKALMDSFNILNKEKIKLEHKLKIAEGALKDIANTEGYIVAQLDAQQALQKMEEVK